MSGRRTFRTFRPLLFGLASVLRVLPRGLREWIWLFADLLPGKVGNGARYSLALASGAQLGENVFFGRNVTVKNWRSLQVGNNVSIHENCFVDALGGIKIGNDVSIAHGSSLVSFDHSTAPSVTLKYGPLLPGSIAISDDVWVSAGVRILRNTKIGPRTVIAANAVVRGKYAGGAIYGGVPAKLLKSLHEPQADLNSASSIDLSSSTSSSDGA